MTFIKNLLRVLFEKIRGSDQDFFLSHKYECIKSYYGNTCLDIGAGTGRFSKFLVEQGHKVTLVDVVDKRKVDLDLITFNGKDLPVNDNSFDTSLFMFVLHHTDTQIELLKEAVRVTKKYIIIGEDIIESRFDKMLGNIHLNTSLWAKGSDSFKSQKRWENVFKNLGLQIVKKVQIPKNVYPIYPVNRIIFVLKKD